jgi:diaminopimelate epimerase
MNLIKAHAFGNDFLLLDDREIVSGRDEPALARNVCARHTGVGADGLLIFTRGDGSRPPAMRLLNADGSRSEISGNGLRCLAAWLAHEGAGPAIAIDTDAGRKHLELLDRTGERYTFRAGMGAPENVRLERIAIDGTSGDTVEAVTLRVGNPQCVVLGEVAEARLHSIAARLAVHPHFPEGTNVELACVDRPDHVRILIWERGVGPTEASGTGACAAAVAAMSYGGAARDVHVESPGGTQRVEWREDGLFLTGWAHIVASVRWLGGGLTP